MGATLQYWKTNQQALASTATTKHEQGSCSSGAPGGAAAANANARGRPGGV